MQSKRRLKYFLYIDLTYNPYECYNPLQILTRHLRIVGNILLDEDSLRYAALVMQCDEIILCKAVMDRFQIGLINVLSFQDSTTCVGFNFTAKKCKLASSWAYQSCSTQSVEITKMLAVEIDYEPLRSTLDPTL